jgi:nucleoside 2-deoxyribosyltransferase
LFVAWIIRGAGSAGLLESSCPTFEIPASPVNSPHTASDTSEVRIYFAAPLFSASERDWNARLAAALRNAGHDVFLPQEKEPGKSDAGIFAADVQGIDWAEALLAIVDGADADSGTSWEVGYAYRKKPIVLVRTDIRSNAASGGPGYNAMLAESATLRIDAFAAPIERVALEVLDALTGLSSAS